MGKNGCTCRIHWVLFSFPLQQHFWKRGRRFIWLLIVGRYRFGGCGPFGWPVGKLAQNKDNQTVVNGAIAKLHWWHLKRGRQIVYMMDMYALRGTHTHTHSHTLVHNSIYGARLPSNTKWVVLNSSCNKNSTKCQTHAAQLDALEKKNFEFELVSWGLNTHCECGLSWIYIRMLFV